MSNSMRCDECGKKSVIPTILDTYSTDLHHDGRKYRVEVRDLAVHRCTACGEVEMDTEAAGRLYDAFRKAIGLMPATEIRRRRKELGLKQEDMAALLGVAVSTLSRWETGAQMQQRCMDTTLRAFFEVPALREFLIRHAGREDLAATASANPTSLARGPVSDEVRWLSSPMMSRPGVLPTAPIPARQAPPNSDSWRAKPGSWRMKTPSLISALEDKLVA